MAIDKSMWDNSTPTKNGTYVARYISEYDEKKINRKNCLIESTGYD